MELGVAIGDWKLPKVADVKQESLMSWVKIMNYMSINFNLMTPNQRKL